MNVEMAMTDVIGMEMAMAMMQATGGTTRKTGN